VNRLIAKSPLSASAPTPGQRHNSKNATIRGGGLDFFGRSIVWTYATIGGLESAMKVKSFGDEKRKVIASSTSVISPCTGDV
jgi:hypothetical protein